MAESSIEWTDATWNPVAGCTVISPGCANCYAMRMAARLDAMGMPKYRALTRRSGKRAVWVGKIVTDASSLKAPLTWKKPRMVFVNSMSDLFHEKVPADFIRQVWTVMEKVPRHTFQILTKRPERMAELTRDLPLLENVWLGTSVESSEYIPRIDALRTARAAVRFISFEPLLGSVKRVNLRNIDWIIVGGESGPKARPMQPEWARELRDQCASQRVAFFFKQWGGARPKSGGRLLDGQEWNGFPAHSKSIPMKLDHITAE